MDHYRQTIVKLQKLLDQIEPVLFIDETIDEFVEKAIQELVNKRNVSKDDDEP